MDHSTEVNVTAVVSWANFPVSRINLSAFQLTLGQRGIKQSWDSHLIGPETLTRSMQENSFVLKDSHLL